MTKKDYELIASVIQGRRINTWNLDKLGWTENEITTSVAVIDDLARILAFELGIENPKFDSNKFLKACGVEVAPCLHLNFTDAGDGSRCVDCGAVDLR